MLGHHQVKAELEKLVKEAERMEATNKTMAEQGRGSPLVDHIVSLTRVVKMMADMQRTGF